MEMTRGRVIELDLAHAEPFARVEVSAAPACARCAAGKGCGAGLLAGDPADRCVEALIGAGLEVCEGDEVRISLAPENLLQASWLVYGLPLCGALSGAALAYLAGLGDLGAALAALAGISAGLGIARRRLSRAACLRRFTPTIVERVAVSH